MSVPMQQNFIMQPARQPPANVNYSPPSSAAVPEAAYKTYEKLIDPEGIFLDKLTRLLYGAALVHSEIFDEKSPVPGFRLVEYGGTLRKKAMNWDGYNTVTNMFILFVTEVISTTEFDSKEINLKDICVDGIMGIMDMMVANRKLWEIRDPMIYVPLGTAMWYNIYGVARRSTGGGKMLQFILGIFRFFGGHKENNDQSNIKWWPSMGKAHSQDYN